MLSLYQCFNSSKRLIEISYQDKKYHFRKLHEKTGIPYDRVVFYDNEHWNIENVKQLGVHCVYTPNGMNKYDYWDNIKENFAINKKDNVNDDNEEH